MNHAEAAATFAAERYLLGEMREDERATFEADGNAYRPKDTGSEAVVYLVEGRQIGYGSKAAWNAARR